jgi:hypothetical protein
LKGNTFANKRPCRPCTTAENPPSGKTAKSHKSRHERARSRKIKRALSPKAVLNQNLAQFKKRVRGIAKDGSCQ